MAELNLKKLVSAVRDELEALDRERASGKRPPLFQLESMELELKFTVAESDSAKGGMDLKIVSFGADKALREEQVQSVRLRYRVAPSAEDAKLLGTRAHSENAADAGTGIESLE